MMPKDLSDQSKFASIRAAWILRVGTDVYAYRSSCPMRPAVIAKMPVLQSLLGLAFRLLLLAVSCFLWVVKGMKRNKMAPIRDPLLLEPGVVLAVKIRTRKIKSETIVKAYVERIRAVNGMINAVVDERFSEAVEEAKEVDKYIMTSGKTPTQLAQEKPFLGVPFSSKEIIAVKGMSLTNGLVWRKGMKAEADCTAVTLMRAAGAIPICVTNVPELSMWADASNKLYGITNNPHDLNRVPGGSSGGEAALLASAGSVIGLGNDIGGSIRIPAFCCGIFGHKPTKKIVSNRGQYPNTDDTEVDQYKVTGPLCRYAADLLPMLKVLSSNNITKLRLDNKVELKNLKIYYTEDYIDNPITPRVNSQISLAVRKIVLHLTKTYGATSKRVSMPALNSSFIMWFSTMVGTSVPQTFAELLAGGQNKRKMKLWLEFLKWPLRLSKHTLHVLFFCALSGIFSSQPMKKMTSYSQQSLARLTRDFQEMLGQDGIFIYPTSPHSAPFHQEQVLKSSSFAFTGIFNLLGFPVTQCPTGTTWQGLPIGVQVASNLYNDRLTLAVAREIEVLYGGWNSPSPIL